VTAWVATIPATAAIGWVMYQTTQLPTVVAVPVVGVVMVALLGAIGWAMLHAMGAQEVEAEVRSTALPTVPVSDAAGVRAA